MLQRPLRILPEAIASACGAALLAGVACGAYGTIRETADLASAPHGTVHPGEASTEYEAAYARYREVYPRLKR